MMSEKTNKTSQPAEGAISRKSFLKQSTLSLLGLSSMGVLPLGLGKQNPVEKLSRKSNNDDNILRTIAYNVFNGCIGYKGINGRELEAGEEYDLVRKARELGQIPKRIALQLALYNPNLVNFSEAPERSVVAMIADMLGMNYAYFSSSDYKGSFPGAILSHYDIISHENRPFVGEGSKDLFTRHWGKAILRLPANNQLIAVHSAHLWYKGDEEGTQIRLREIAELIKAIDFDLKNNVQSVILQGDLNHRPDSPEYKALEKGGLVDLFNRKGEGNGYTTRSYGPQRRIDYIRAKGPLVDKMSKYKVLFEGDFRINNDDPRSFALSDHLPVLGEFQL